MSGPGYSTRERRLATITLTVVGLALVFRFAIQPSWTRYRQLTADLAAEKAAVAQAEARNERNRAYRATWRELRPALKAHDPPTYFKQLEAELPKLGLELIRSNPGAPQRTEEPGILRYPLDLTLEGDNSALVELLTRIKKAPAFLRLDSLNVQLRKKKRLQITLNISTLASREDR